MAENVDVVISGGVVEANPDRLQPKGPNVQIHWKIVASAGWEFARAA